MNAATFLASLALLIWLSSVAIAARRERTFSAPLIAATWLTAVGPFASFALTGFPFGLIVTIPYAAALGISLVRRGASIGGDRCGRNRTGSVGGIAWPRASRAPCVHPA